MSRRIEIELTSRREDGSWTWRAAGAKHPKGELDGGVLPEGAAVGDVLRADAEIDLDGILITAVLPPKTKRGAPATIEVIGTRRDEAGVTTDWVERPRRDRKGGGRSERDGDRRGGAGRPRGGGDRRGGDTRDNRGERPRGERAGPDDRPSRGERRQGPRGPRPERPALPPKPKPKRLKPGREHRASVLDELAPEQRPIAEQVLRGGMAAVRQAIDKQNEAARADGQPEIQAGPLLAIAEELLPRLRAAKWRDEADAALAQVGDVDLRDLRSVVVASDTGARDEESREIAQRLRDGLTARVEKEHAEWMRELAELLADGRVVRALRLSSRPPKAGAPLPTDLAARLAEATSASLAADTPPERYGRVLDALAFSPVRTQVVPAGRPEKPADELIAAVRKLGSRLPQIAELFGVTPTAAPPKSGRGGTRRGAIPPPPPPPGATSPEAPDPGAGPAPTTESTPEPAPEPAPEPSPEVG